MPYAGPDAPERLRDYNRRYYEANRRELKRRARARAKRRREAMPEAVRAEKRRWARVNVPIRAARLRGASVERVDPEVVLVRDCGICGICGLAVGPDWHLDHVVALANGGAHSYANTQVSHASCNVLKGARET